MKDEWALVTEGSGGASRAAVATVQCLAAAGYRAAVTVSTGNATLAAASRFCARRVQVPSARDDPEGYARALRDELDRNTYLTAFPASDAAALALDPRIVRFQDKLAWPERARAVGLETPSSRVFDSAAELISARHEFEYPLIVKPNLKRFLAVRIKSPEALAAYRGDGPLIVQQYLDAPAGGVLGLMWHGRLVAAVHLRYLRVWPYPCGTAAAAETIKADPKLDERLERFFSDFEGVFHVDMLGSHLIDVNPRVHATLPVAAAAGVNLVGLYCDLLNGAPVRFTRGRAGLFYRWIEGDVRFALRGLGERRLSMRSALAGLAPRRGTAHSFERIDDPIPLLMRVGSAVRRIASRSGSPTRPTIRGPIVRSH